jgi:hypothetical protein
MESQELMSAESNKPLSSGGEHGSGRSNASSSPPKLKPVECFFALLVLGLWLILFAGGILMDTEPYRCAISSGGVQALQVRSSSNESARDICKKYEPLPSPMSSSWFSAWFFVLFLFLPLNLALICVTAGALGTFGSIANLHNDQSRNSPRDYSNPYISGLLRALWYLALQIKV